MAVRARAGSRGGALHKMLSCDWPEEFEFDSVHQEELEAEVTVREWRPVTHIAIDGTFTSL